MPRTETINIIVQTKSAEKDVKKLGKGLEETKKQGKATGVGISGIFSGIKQGVTQAIPALNAFKTSLISTGVGALVVAVGGLITLMSKSLGKATEFSKAMSSVGAVSGASAEELAALSKSAKELGSTTAFTAVQVAELQTEFAKLGFNTQEIIDASEATLGLAASLDVGLADAATLAGSTLRSFGLDTKETQRVVDVMAASASSSALDFSSLTESLKLVAPTSRAVGLTIEQTTAMLGALANSGLKGSVAGTGLSKTFIELNKKGLTLEQAFAKINSSSNKLNTAIDLVGVVGAKSLQTLANSAEDIVELNKILDESGEAFGGIGAAAGIAQKRLDNLAGDITKLDSAWEGFLLSIEDGEGAISQLSRGAVQLLTVGISKLQVISREFGYYWDGLMMTLNKSIANTSKTWDGFFGQIESTAGLYGAKIKKSLSDVPLLGRGIDKKAAEEDIAYYTKFLDYYVKVSKEASEQVNNFQANVSIARFKGEAEVAEAKKAREALVAEQQITEQEITDEAKDAEKKRLEQVAKLREKFKKAQEDLDAKTAEEKLTLQRQRAIAELDAIKTTEEEKRQLLLDINALYDQKEAELAEQKRLADKAKSDAEFAKDADARKLLREQKIADAKAVAQAEDEIRQANLDNVSQGFALLSQLAGKNKALQAIALLGESATGIAKIIINTKAANAAATLKYAALPGGIALAKAEQAANNVSAGIGIAATTAATAKGLSALKAGGSAPSANIGSEGGGARRGAATPSFNIVGQTGTNQLAESISGQEKQPIKAYVVSSDVTSAQSMERNIVSGASI
jgi:hypothetical protein